VERGQGGRPDGKHLRKLSQLLAAFLGHGDVLLVTPANIVAFKDHRLAMGASAKTVGDSDLSALRSLFGWAKSNHRRTDNPTGGIKVTRAKQTRLRSKDLSRDPQFPADCLDRLPLHQR
jgi:site-specific recombinase XerD